MPKLKEFLLGPTKLNQTPWGLHVAKWINCTRCPVLCKTLKDGGYLSIREGLTVGMSLQPFYRVKGAYQHVGTHSTNTTKECRLLLAHKLGRELEEGEQCHHEDRNKWNDTEDNLTLLTLVEHARLHGLEDNVMHKPGPRANHKIAMGSEEYRSKQSKMMKELLTNPDNRKKRLAQIQKQRKQTSETVKRRFREDPQYYYNYLVGRRDRNGKPLASERVEKKFRERFPEGKFPPVDNHEIVSISEEAIEPVYDMEVEQYHNFAAHGIFIHNSEDVVGRPFVGPAGHLLDSLIAEARVSLSLPPDRPKLCFTNVIACIPKRIIPPTASKVELEKLKKITPLPSEIEACNPRLAEFIAMVKPKLIVGVGEIAAKEIKKRGWDKIAKTIEIRHPAWILRLQNEMPSQYGLEVQRCRVQLADAFYSLQEKLVITINGSQNAKQEKQVPATSLD